MLKTIAKNQEWKETELIKRGFGKRALVNGRVFTQSAFLFPAEGSGCPRAGPEPSSKQTLTTNPDNP